MKRGRDEIKRCIMKDTDELIELTFEENMKKLLGESLKNQKKELAELLKTELAELLKTELADLRTDVQAIKEWTRDPSGIQLQPIRKTPKATPKKAKEPKATPKKAKEPPKAKETPEDSSSS
eukprot:TRINITY_DN486_c0_g1_i1.p1 TRINITY_DN486_c0_g1~~TRINITY_DN486_c0_g1_i1.p1  ORF type:complete len:122 (-),score=32.14 TRINITY_DN486_c0_g1_i1:233-598(-)